MNETSEKWENARQTQTEKKSEKIECKRFGSERKREREICL